jgi:hypothetical protein
MEWVQEQIELEKQKNPTVGGFLAYVLQPDSPSSPGPFSSTYPPSCLISFGPGHPVSQFMGSAGLNDRYILVAICNPDVVDHTEILRVLCTHVNKRIRDPRTDSLSGQWLLLLPDDPNFLAVQGPIAKEALNAVVPTTIGSVNLPIGGGVTLSFGVYQLQ